MATIRPSAPAAGLFGAWNTHCSGQGPANICVVRPAASELSHVRRSGQRVTGRLMG